MLTNVPQSNKPFQSIATDVPLSNKPCISQSNIYLSNEPVLTNVPLSNEPMLTNVPHSIEPEPIIGQTEPSDPVGLQYILGIPKEIWFNLYIIMSREKAEKRQTRLTPWVTDRCESKKFVADSPTCRVRTPCHHFQMTSYGRTDSINNEDGTCSCRWGQTMGIPCKHGVCVLGLANVDPTTRVSEYFTNDTYKVAYEPIWIPIRGIEQWKILKTDPRVHTPIPTVRTGHPRTQRKRG
ncbi:hypothetical protein GIB67_000251 [Kingdonia uniflora]|uniref:SWIM-type domain-containing protein n=1 Tax=Kingdonia uniflora TaxID=39325 RepID=A0A7J7LC57_9MAGN|nr:hypothetical protein GIB67_000251 [Kingdonia uniflora]